MLRSGRQPVALDYDMEKTPSGWKCYNVYVGGVSLVLNYRTEFSSEVRKSGIDGLIGVLEKNVITSYSIHYTKLYERKYWFSM